MFSQSNPICDQLMWYPLGYRCSSICNVNYCMHYLSPQTCGFSHVRVTVRVLSMTSLIEPSETLICLLLLFGHSLLDMRCCFGRSKVVTIVPNGSLWGLQKMWQPWPTAGPKLGCAHKNKWHGDIALNWTIQECNVVSLFFLQAHPKRAWWSSQDLYAEL